MEDHQLKKSKFTRWLPLIFFVLLVAWVLLGAVYYMIPGNIGNPSIVIPRNIIGFLLILMVLFLLKNRNQLVDKNNSLISKQQTKMLRITIWIRILVTLAVFIAIIVLAYFRATSEL